MGCFRTPAEIAAWSGLSEAQREAVMQDLDHRRASRREERRRQRERRRGGP
jgi:predicted Fe-S protein YdhL (DUF1289 family)